ncbi:hypothetical protein K2173_021667 [Erythroxylum novogranatense]|uniref:Uncharacterized protein n=1 Tax=Erythroxylum novogranatense TaxID=1862640 RepID=A0AAV8TH90_9ROSI|nr:hypothetical protein K2173_021667 [Erythroxylum novogranatense]
MTKLQSSDAGKLAVIDKVCYDGASTELVEIEASIILEGKAVVSEPMLLGTSTFWIAPQRHQVDNSAESNKHCMISCEKLLKLEASVDIGDGIILNTEVNTMQEQNFLEKEMERILEGDNQDDSNKNNKKALKFCLCSSKRLAGVEPELMPFASKFQHYHAGEAIHADNGSFVLGKTLTGAIPVESAVDTLVISIPATDIRNENNLLPNNMERSNNEITVNDNGLEKIDSKKTQNNSRRSHKRKDFAPYVLADEASEQLEAGAETQNDHHEYTNRKATEFKVSSDKCKEPVCNYFITENQSIKLDMEKINENPESEPFSLSDYWSEYPCLEFAVKTLAGALPVEDPLALHGYFQQVNTQTQKEAYQQQQANTIQFYRDANLAPPNIGF